MEPKNISIGKIFIVPSFFMNLVSSISIFSCSILSALFTLFFIGKNATTQITLIEIIAAIVLIGTKTLMIYKVLRPVEKSGINYKLIMIYLLDVLGLIALFVTVSWVAIIISKIILAIWLLSALIYAIIYYRSISSKDFQNRFGELFDTEKTMEDENNTDNQQ
ncbi:MAG: hypothetical protein Q8936_21455 [Bacillota bacterium]|nr:hypothetical protein [Bacillota bacterium]